MDMAITNQLDISFVYWFEVFSVMMYVAFKECTCLTT